MVSNTCGKKVRGGRTRNETKSKKEENEQGFGFPLPRCSRVAEKTFHNELSIF